MRKVERDCPVCGSAYHADPVRLGHGRQTTCSRACSYVLRGRKLEQRIVVVCASCGKQLSRAPRQVKAKHGASYCSRSCHYAGRSAGLTPRVVTLPYQRTAPPPSPEQIARTVATRRARDNYRHSDDTRARLREATARRIAEGRVPAVSNLEHEVAARLDALGVSYRRSVPIRGDAGRFVAVADFALDDGSVLEVNGTFWHADPRFYPDGPVYPAQLRTAAAWDRKLIALDRLGIRLRVAWEADLQENATQALRIALA